MSEWYSFNDQMNEIFGGKVLRLSLSTGCTCPNRDGSLSSGGCIFCSEGGSGDFAFSGELSAQIEAAKRSALSKIGKNADFAGYMAYFQPFTNTYGDTDSLAELFEQAAAYPEVVSLCIATRPDCISDEMICRLAAVNEKTPVFVELGLQTVHEDTAAYINRCYETRVFEDAFMRLKSAGLRTAAHVIVGLPGEDARRTKETVKYLSSLKYVCASSSGRNANPFLDGIKLQLLYVLKNTPLAHLLPEPPFVRRYDAAKYPQEYLILNDGMYLPLYSLYEYANLIKELIEELPEKCAVYRATGDAPGKDLILPVWAADKKRVLNAIRARF